MMKRYSGKSIHKIIPSLIKNRLYVPGWGARILFDYILNPELDVDNYAKGTILENSKLYLSVYFNKLVPIAWCLVIKTDDEFIIHRFTKKKFRRRGIARLLCEYWLRKFHIPNDIIKNDLGDELVYFK